MFNEWIVTLGEPVDAVPLALFRILLGLVLCAHTLTHARKAVWYYTRSPFYCGFELTSFLRTPSHSGITAVIAGQVLCTYLLCVGLFHPWGGFFEVLLFGYLFLIDKTTYNNHHYLTILLLFLLSVTDSAAVLSFDSLTAQPHSDNGTVPYWQLLIVQLQLAIVYTYGGLNKLNKDWLLRGQPTKIALHKFQGRTHLRFKLRHYCFNEAIATKIKRLFQLRATPYVINWMGTVVDLSIIWLLMCDATRPWALPFFFAFHFFNQWFFAIEAFPLINYASAVLFLRPETLWHVLAWIGVTHD